MCGPSHWKTIFVLDFGGSVAQDLVTVSLSNQNLLDPLCDTARFWKRCDLFALARQASEEPLGQQIWVGLMGGF